MDGWVVKWQYILVIALGWGVAQFLKTFLIFVSKKNREGITDWDSRSLFKKFWKALWISGGMPSSHTSIVTSLTTYVGLKEGFSSAYFGVALCFMLVVIYDSLKVRYSVGRQALTLNKVLKQGNFRIDPVKVVEGHTGHEVLGGFIVGLLVAFFTFWLFGGDIIAVFKDIIGVF